MSSINSILNNVAVAAFNGVSTLVESGKYLFRYGSRYYVVNADFNPKALEEGVWNEFGLDEINPDDPLLGGLPDDEQFELVEPVELNSDSNMARWSSPMETPNVCPFVTYVRKIIAEQMMQGFTLTPEEKMNVGAYVQAYNIAVSNNDTNIQELQTEIRVLLQTLYPHLVL